MCVLGAGGQDGGSVRDCIIKDVYMKFKYRNSGLKSIINSLFDFGRVPFSLWFWCSDSEVPCYSLPPWLGY